FSTNNTTPIITSEAKNVAKKNTINTLNPTGLLVLEEVSPEKNEVIELEFSTKVPTIFLTKIITDNAKKILSMAKVTRPEYFSPSSTLNGCFHDETNQFQ